MKRAVIFSMTFISLLASCSSSKKSTAEPDTEVRGVAAQGIVIDGKAADWQNMPVNLSPRGTIQYALANNDQDLYILLRVPDPAEQIKLLRGGMQVYIAPGGQKEKTVQVVYPVKGELSEEEMRPQTQPGEKPNLTLLHQHITSQLISLNREGFKPVFNGVQSIRENTGFRAAINWNENNDLVYELVIPFAAFPAPVKRDKIELGFFINGVERPKQTAGPGENNTGWSGSGEGMRGGGMGGHRGNFGGGRGGSYGGQRSGQRTPTNWQKMYENENFWVNYTAAGKIS